MFCSTLLDDFGLKPLRAPQDEDFHDLVAERYEQGATIITSNLDFSEWGDAFPNRLLGAATLDRLRHGAYRLTLEGESYRSPRPMPERRKSTVATARKNKKYSHRPGPQISTREWLHKAEHGWLH